MRCGHQYARTENENELIIPVTKYLSSIAIDNYLRIYFYKINKPKMYDKADIKDPENFFKDGNITVIFPRKLKSIERSQLEHSFHYCSRQCVELPIPPVLTICPAFMLRKFIRRKTGITVPYCSIEIYDNGRTYVMVWPKDVQLPNFQIALFIAEWRNHYKLLIYE